MKTVLAAAAAIAFALAGSAAAQEFPTAPVTMVVPFPAGGPTEHVGQRLAGAMGDFLGQPVTVTTVEGAGGVLGATQVAAAQPDGYTILLYHIGMATTPTLVADLPFDPLTDFAEIGLAVTVPMVIIGRSDLGPTDLAGLVTMIRENPGRLRMAHLGTGSGSYLCALLFTEELGLDIELIAYPALATAAGDVANGAVDLMCDQTTAPGRAPAGRTILIQGIPVTAFAIMSAERIPMLAEVPTVAEEGFPELAIEIWHGLWAPAGTPPATVERLTLALQAALANPDVAATLTGLGAELPPIEAQRPEALHALVAAEIEHWRGLLEGMAP